MDTESEYSNEQNTIVKYLCSNGQRSQNAYYLNYDYQTPLFFCTLKFIEKIRKMNEMYAFVPLSSVRSLWIAPKRDSLQTIHTFSSLYPYD